jgi:two-component system, sensor histidine kinase and response regulator
MMDNAQEYCNYLFTNDYAVILIVDPESGRLIDANDAACKFYGYTKEQIKTLNIRDINTLQIGELNEEMKNAVIKKKSRFFFKHKLSDGTIKDVEVLSGPVKMVSGTALYSIVHDRTLQKKNEDELMKFKKAVDTSGEIIFMTDMNGIITYINPEFSKMYGYAEDEVVGKTTPRILKGEIKDDEKYKKIWTAIYNKEVYKGEFLNKTRNGELIDIEASINPIMGESNEIIGFLTIQKNITQRKAIEKKLIESEARFRRIFEEGPLGMAIVDFDLYIQSSNPRAAQILGYKTNEMTGLEIKNITHPDDYASDLELRKMVINGTIPFYQMDKRYLKKNGEVIWINLTVTAIRNKEKEPLYFLSMIEDISDRKKNEEKLKELNDSKDKLFSIIAHDLRSPFHALLGFSEFLANDYEQLSSEEVKRFAGNINKSANSVFALLQNLLQWSMLQTGRIEYSPSSFKLDSLIEEIHSLYIINAVKKDINLNFDRFPEIKVFADKNMTHTVLRNLISNAIKFTNPGGEVGISISEEENSVKIVISDTGVGISSADLENMFKLNNTAVKRGTQNETGTGLGLILCKEFIEKNNGKFTVESEENKGSKFIFTLPKE